MVSAVSSISSAVSALMARQTFGSRKGRKRGAIVGDRAKVIRSYERRDLTGA